MNLDILCIQRRTEHHFHGRSYQRFREYFRLQSFDFLAENWRQKRCQPTINAISSQHRRRRSLFVNMRLSASYAGPLAAPSSGARLQPGTAAQLSTELSLVDGIFIIFQPFSSISILKTSKSKPYAVPPPFCTFWSTVLVAWPVHHCPNFQGGSDFRASIAMAAAALANQRRALIALGLKD